MNTQQQATAAPEFDIAVLWCNHYQCSHCGSEWQLVADTQTETACQSCGVQSVEPSFSEGV